jgi:hypothetical protein
MTHEQAHRILDRVKDGAAYSSRIVDAALWLTGDLDAHEAVRSEGMAQEIQSESIDRWSAMGKSMVATNHYGHRAHPWSRSSE